MTDSQERPAFDKGQVELFISTAAENRANKKNETVVREVLVAHLAKIFGQPWPWWVTHHMHGAEHHLKYLKEGQEAQGFGDSVVGATAIEYESDLTSIPKFNEGQTQVKQYCAGLLNQGVAAETVRGILSDTVEWYAYEIGAVTPKATGAYDQDDVQLAEVEKLVCDPGDPKRADRLVDFWLRHLAREGTRPLTARSIAEYLAPTSVIAQPGVEALARDQLEGNETFDLAARRRLSAVAADGDEARSRLIAGNLAGPGGLGLDADDSRRFAAGVDRGASGDCQGGGDGCRQGDEGHCELPHTRSITLGCAFGKLFRVRVRGRRWHVHLRDSERFPASPRTERPVGLEAGGVAT